MTAFKTALTASLLLIAIIISNMIFIRSTEGTILDEIAMIESYVGMLGLEGKQKTLEAISRLSDYWQGRRELVALSVPYTQISKISELIRSLESYYERDELGEFENTKELLKLALEACKSI